jgi:beta-glucosidase
VLRGFERITLAPGEKRTVTFTLQAEDLQLLNRDMKWVVEPGTFEVRIGASSTDIRVKDTFVIAPALRTRALGHRASRARLPRLTSRST